MIGFIRRYFKTIVWVAVLAFAYPLLYQTYLFFNRALTHSSERGYRVERILDGDTISLTNGERVRYFGMDAPEISHFGSKAEPFAYAASKVNAELVSHKEVDLDIFGRDHYHRLLAYIYVQNSHPMSVLEGLFRMVYAVNEAGSHPRQDSDVQLKFSASPGSSNQRDLNLSPCLEGKNKVWVNCILVGLGVATLYQKEKVFPKKEILLEMQREALKLKIGLWGLNYSPFPYWVGTAWSFHRSDCKFIRDSRHPRKFKDWREAIQRGLHPCRTCLPLQEFPNTLIDIPPFNPSNLK